MPGDASLQRTALEAPLAALEPLLELPIVGHPRGDRMMVAT
jgi:hypothetical protein